MAYPPLTPREQQVAELIAEGAHRKHIARELGMTIWTVDFHMQNIAKKISGNGRLNARVTRFILASSSTAA